jgi:transposase InsO family protein
VYNFIKEQCEGVSIALACMVLNVRREGYYEWHSEKKVEKRVAKKEREEALLANLKKIKSKNKKYGVIRLQLSLPEDCKASYGKVYRVCKENNLLQKVRRLRSLTKSDKEAKFSEDLIKRNFKADSPNVKWLTDIKEVVCKDGKLYIAPVLDCFDGAIVGLSIDNNMKATLCKNAVKSAIYRYAKYQNAPLNNLICHSDRGSQYTSSLFRDYLNKYGIKQSMGRTGSCYDNARMESFFATLEKELLTDLNLLSLTKSTLRALIFRFIETEYNSTRLYSANQNYLPPLVKRNFYFNNIKTFNLVA